MVSQRRKARMLVFKTQGCKNQAITSELDKLKKICGTANLFFILEERDGAFKLEHCRSGYVTTNYFHKYRFKEVGKPHSKGTNQHNKGVRS